MIRYVGGKTRHAKTIAAILRTNTGYQYYLEPFFGGGSMARETVGIAPVRVASDINSNLMELYQAIQRGWRPPETVNEEVYTAAKSWTDSPTKTYIGFACSYGGKWFGGYARDKKTGRDLTHESYNRIMRDAQFLRGMKLFSRSYDEWYVDENFLVYCDPPYRGTLGYGDSFDHDHFWDIMREWSESGARVYISEYQAPADFVSVWSKPTSVAIHNQATNNRKLEQLFTYAGKEQV